MLNAYSIFAVMAAVVAIGLYWQMSPRKEITADELTDLKTRYEDL